MLLMGYGTLYFYLVHSRRPEAPIWLSVHQCYVANVHCPHSMQSLCNCTVFFCLVRPSICLSVAAGPTAANPLLQVCCCEPSGQQIHESVAAWPAPSNSIMQRVNACSATLSVYAVSRAQTCIFSNVRVAGCRWCSAHRSFLQ